MTADEQIDVGDLHREGEQVVTLRQDGRTLWVEPPCPEVRDLLRTARHGGSPDPQHGYRVARKGIPMYRLVPGGGGHVLQCSAALEPAVRHARAAAGYAVRQVGTGMPPWPAPQLEVVLKGLGTADEPFLKMLQNDEQGLALIAPDMIQPALLVAQVALVWPDKKVAVAVTRIEDAYRVGQQLRKYLPDGTVTAITGKDSPARVGRVVVGTYKGLFHTPARLHRRDVVIALDAVEAMSAHGLECLRHAREARLSGLLDVNAQLSPFEQDQLASVFGFRQVLIPRHGHHERQVQVVHVSGTSGMPLADDLGIVQLKRRGLWHHERRNRMLARVARAALLGDQQQLLGLVPELAALPPTPRKVFVMVENVEHALALAEWLPGWPLLTGPSPWKEGLDPQQAAVLEQGRMAESMSTAGAIVTSTALAAIDLNDVDVLVRADGGVGLPPVPAHGLVVPNEQVERPLLVVDVDDRHHPLFRKWSRMRKTAYEERGWLAPGMDAIRVRVEQFLAGRRVGAKG